MDDYDEIERSSHSIKLNKIDQFEDKKVNNYDNNNNEFDF